MLSHSSYHLIHLPNSPAGWGLVPNLAAQKLRFAEAEELPAFQRQEVAEWRLSKLLRLTPKPRLWASLSKEKVLVSKKKVESIWNSISGWTGCTNKPRCAGPG